MTRHNQHKTSLRNPFQMWYRWKYSGFVTVPVVAVIILAVMISWNNNMEFFEMWSCDTIYKYIQDTDVPVGMTSHEDLTILQHDRLHVIFAECQTAGTFSPDIIP